MTSDLPHSPKAEMIRTFQTIWTHASQAETKFIQEIWEAILKSAQILKWEYTGKLNEFKLELKQEIVGSHPALPIGNIVLKQKMEVAFLEEKIPGTQRYRQVISFPDKGVCYRMGLGWLSKDSPIREYSD